MQLELKEGSNGRMSLNVAKHFVCATGGVFYTMYDVCGIFVIVKSLRVRTLNSMVYS